MSVRKRQIKEVTGHEARRREVSQLASRIIAREGIAGLTVRDLAAEAGYSTHVVSHYFSSKEDLLVNTLRECAKRQVNRLKDAISSGADILGCMEAMLPLDQERVVDARVWMVFWPYAISDPVYAKEQNVFGARWRHLMVGMLRFRGVLTLDTPKAERDALGRKLQMIIAGIAIHGALGVWNPEEQKDVLRQSLALLFGSRTGRHEARESIAPLAKENERLARENERLRSLLINALLQASDA